MKRWPLWLLVALLGALSATSVAHAQDAGRCPTWRDGGSLRDAGEPEARPPSQVNHCPNVLIMLDNSCSMSASAGRLGDGGMATKWTAAVAALTTMLTRTGTSVRFGLSLFPCPHCAAACGDPTLAQAVAVEPGPANASAVRAALFAAMRTCSTPTAEYLNVAATDEVLADPTRASYVILITDGEPTCHTGTETNRASTELAIARLAAQGVPTFVIGFDMNVDANALNCFAALGQRPQPAPATTRFYNASDEASLQTALDAISAVLLTELGTTSCDESCYTMGCPAGQRCVAAACVPDPCLTETCDQGTFCRSGACVRTCPAGCPTGHLCNAGDCVPDPCATLSCPGCLQGVCPSGACLDPDGTPHECGPGRVCRGNVCIDEPCLGVQCPAGLTCDRGGGCTGRYDGGIDGGSDGAGAHACGCRAPGGQTSGWPAPSLVIAVVLVRRRRR